MGNIMPIIIGGKVYYRIQEVAEVLGVHRSTLHRWFREGSVTEVARDRRGWRIFSEEDIEALRQFAEQIRDAKDD
jgi:excisionase family DNA binding protein